MNNMNKDKKEKTKITGFRETLNIFIYIAAFFGVMLSLCTYSGVLTFSQPIETSHIYTDINNLTNTDVVVHELNSDGWVLYYSNDCTYCDIQKDILGDSWKYLNKVNGNNYYVPEWLEGYPCWYNYKIDTQIYGSQNITNLVRMYILIEE